MLGTLQAWLLEHLSCPRDGGPLRLDGDLSCERGYRFPIVDGIPVLLVDELPATHTDRDESLGAVARGEQPAPAGEASGEGHVDRFVQAEIVKTNGNLYRHLLGRLPRYPIPELRLPPGSGRPLLEVGCNWGRWTLAAARAGYRPVGLDPSLQAVWAGQRVARQLGLEAAFVVGDARQLPFSEGSFDASFSYSVRQHFDKADARSEALRAVCNVVPPLGRIADSLYVRSENAWAFRTARRA